MLADSILLRCCGVYGSESSKRLGSAHAENLTRFLHIACKIVAVPSHLESRRVVNFFVVTTMVIIVNEEERNNEN